MDFNENEKESHATNIGILTFLAEGITDRDAPALYAPPGVGRDLYRLWSDKVNLEVPEPSMLSPDRPLIEEAAKIFAETLVLAQPEPLTPCYAQNKAMDFMRAEIDAATFGNRVFARIINASDEELFATSDVNLPERGGRVPERYWIEIQHALSVVGFDKAYFVAAVETGEGNICIASTAVKADPVFISNHTAECIRLWDFVRRGEKPPEAVEPPADELEDLTDETCEGKTE